MVLYTDGIAEQILEVKSVGLDVWVKTGDIFLSGLDSGWTDSVIPLKIGV